MQIDTLKLQIESDLIATVREFSEYNSLLGDEVLQAHIYPIQAGGKRVRALILHLTARCLGGEKAQTLASPLAVALECVHSYSLVHDDLPCMDNDDMRRGKPTPHKVYGDAKALLVGDGLLTMAFESLAHLPPGYEQLSVAAIQKLSRAAGARGMIHGQWLDLSYPTSHKSLGWDDILLMHRLKTGELFAASFELGVMCAHAIKKNPLHIDEDWAKLGYDLGLCFQIMDDVLDATATSDALGKTAGKDLQQNKLTTVSLLGLKGANAEAKKLTENCLSQLNKLLFKYQIDESSETYKQLYLFVEKLVLRKK